MSGHVITISAAACVIESKLPKSRQILGTVKKPYYAANLLKLGSDCHGIVKECLTGNAFAFKHLSVSLILTPAAAFTLPRCFDTSKRPRSNS